MRNHLLLFVFLCLCSFQVFSGVRQLKDKPPTMPNPLRREPIKISLADFDENPFDYEISAEVLIAKLGKKFKVAKEIVRNTHNARIKDTIFHLSYQTTKIKIYKSQGNEMIFSAQISDSAVEMRNKINIGMSKEEFWRKFTDLEKYQYQQGVIEMNGEDEMSSYVLTLQPNLIKVSNMMGTADYTFAFMDNKLSQININVYMD